MPFMNRLDVPLKPIVRLVTVISWLCGSPDWNTTVTFGPILQELTIPCLKCIPRRGTQ